MTKYLSIDFTSSMFFEYSKTSKEGFEAHTSATGKESFRKYFNKGITGKLTSVSIKDTKIGQQLWISLTEDSGDNIVAQLGLYDQKGNVDNSFAEPIIRLVNNLEKNTIYKIVPYNLSADSQKEYDETTEGREVREKYYDRRGVSVKTEDGSKVRDTLTYGDSGNIPSIVWKDHPSITGKKKPSAASLEEKTEFLIGELQAAISGGLAYKNTNSSQTSQTTSNSKETTPIVEGSGEDAEHDDLPF